MSPATLDSLVGDGRLERVQPDSEAARSRLQEARRHLSSAAAIAPEDAPGAYALLYVAARKAIDAHMLARGYRIRKGRLGAHETTGVYALIALGSITEHVEHFDRMRRNRNRSEYGMWATGASTMASDLSHATGIVDAVEGDL